MNEFVATVNGNKKYITVIDNQIILFKETEIEYSLSKISEFSYLLKIGNRVYDLTTNIINNEKIGVLIDGHYFETTIRTSLQEKANELTILTNQKNHHDSIKAPMPGLIIKIKKVVGEKIEIGESVIILEAMKMENDLRAPSSGIIKEIFVKEGNSIEKGSILLSIE
ncbi:MAG: acetyl-CoA carboxylase biotin carboxyl carrier protein subunit [Ignavibacteriales bacterium]|nr:acetyl-CoA carboxylase biotin carboxyl carrier protein subunit [Ignavibacteriales bacterium]